MRMFVTLILFLSFGTLQCQLLRRTRSACTLNPDPLLEYSCSSPGVTESRKCLSIEPDGTTVRPKCVEPYYYSPAELNPMRCYDGLWDNVATGTDCKLECGRFVRKKLGPRPPERNEILPWHVFILRKKKTTSGRLYWKYHCGGSLIDYNTVISALRCVWSIKFMKLLKPKVLKVEVGGNGNRQTSEVKDIKSFSNPDPSFKTSDIVIMILTETLKYSLYVHPVCIDFDEDFKEEQMHPGVKGKFTNQGENIEAEPLTKVLDIPYVGSYELCNGTDYLPDPDKPTYSILKFFKFCVGSEDEKLEVCKTNAGTGVAFPNTENGIERHYLRGIISMDRVYNQGELGCDSLTYVLLEDIQENQGIFEDNWTKRPASFEVFDCLDGSKILMENRCDGAQECADGSDEEATLCGYQTSTTVSSISNITSNGKCLLPPYPEFGSYVTNVEGAEPGHSYGLVTLNVTCYRGYGLVGPSSLFCLDGFWSEAFLKCVRLCQVPEHPSVEYRCVEPGLTAGLRACRPYEPAGTTVSPKCREPNYHTSNSLSLMRCSEDGYWDYTARCSPECGTVSPYGAGLAVGGQTAKKGEFPWHAGIYKKTWNPYMQVCGGSLISNSIIISAAHCFWTTKDKQLPAEQFAVAVGKVYRPWNDSMDEAQKSDVKEIHLPERYQGIDANYQDDIAVVIVTEPFEYKTYIRPVCLSFDVQFERLQLQPRNMGKVAGWGLTAENGKPSPTLQVVQMPLVDIKTCIDDYPPDFREYITGDKICAGTLNPNLALCRGDSGGGLVFSATEKFTERYFLRGVVSTAPNAEGVLCNTATYTSFTRIRSHEDFIKQFWIVS